MSRRVAGRQRAAPTAPEPAPTASRAIAALGTVVAPTTLLTALLFYFGRLHVTGYFGYFGVNFTALDLTTTDYLVRSADGLFVPVAVGTAIVLAGVGINRDIVARLGLERRRTVQRILVAGAASIGLVLIGTAAVGIADPGLFMMVSEVPGLALSAGVLLLAYAVGVLRALRQGPDQPRTPPAVVEWIGVFLLVSVGLFWSVGNYALQVGTGRGSDTVAALATWPDVTILTDDELRLSGPGVTETACGNEKPTYRTTGLKLVFTSSEMYFLLPRDWSREHGGALLVPRGDGLRLRFDPVGAADGPC